MQAKWYGVIGLGRMGGALVRNLHKVGGHAVVFDVNPGSVAELEAEGAVGARDLGSLVDLLPKSPRVIWMMVPAGEAVDNVIRELKPHLKAGDVLIDGGNSFYRDSVRRAAEMEEMGVQYLDCGSSGGLEGALNGLCLMVGGKKEAFELAEPLFRAISQPGGYAHVGPSGAGHFVKMVHNGIEYGILQAIGEGFELLEASPFDVDNAQVAELWNHGSVVRGWLMELAARAFRNDPHLEGIRGEVGGGSTGSWAIEEAWKAGVPTPVIAMSYAMRLRSRQEDTMSGKVVAALRREFGGHAVQAK
ncbi:MAG: 6-phosphogluconate dehydrogenase, decarboxylating [Symbiobacteriaceae bacterium]|jgi:6-phosphogluconate dehydrogenase|nr:6-phosphogluconate dehydrogenase, decarboxylating [Symbiobacteriaceae bacterium]